MPSAISLAGGAALGLASSLHCVGMCGGISVLFGYSPGCGAQAASRTQAMLHGGRIISYMSLGALAGAVGSTALVGLDPGTGHFLLRWAAALSLGWIGLAMVGLIPSPAFLAHAGLPRPAMRLILRLLPCGMVYGALLFAMFAGTALGGALVMLGFGLGTLPALIVASLGFARAQAALRTHGAEKWLGAAVTALAILSLVDSPTALRSLCTHLARSFLS
jgi:sulfite exporter TauE/SafE